MSAYKDKAALRWSEFTWCDFRLSLGDALIILCVPFTLLLLNQTWTYTRYSFLDEWMYVGYGYNYFDPTFYPLNYKISRLPWVLTEALVRGFFSPLVSSWILACGISGVGSAVLYFALRITFGRLPALCAGIFIAGLTFLHANGGADYHNTLAGAFYCLSMLFAARCARQPLALRDLVFFGAALALTIHTNPVFANLAPILFAQYLLSYRVNHFKFPPLLPALFLMSFGAVGVTILLGAINLSLGRQFLFFAEQLKLVSYYIADSSRQKSWWQPWHSYWFLNFPYTGVFFAGALLCIGTLYVAMPRCFLSPRYVFASIFSAAYLTSLSVWIFWQSFGQTALQPSYFAFPLGFPLAGALAGAIATVEAPRSRPAWLTIGAIVFAALIIFGVYDAARVRTFLGTISWPSAVGPAVAFSIAFALVLLSRVSLWLAPAAVVALAAANATAVFTVADYGSSQCTLNRDAYQLIVESSKILRDKHVPGSSVFLFSDEGELMKLSPGCEGSQAPLSWIHDAIAAAGDFRYLAPAWDHKTLETIEPERWREIVEAKGLVAYLTYDPKRISLLNQMIRTAGAPAHEAQLFRLKKGETELPLYILSLDH
ncbi:MAG: hypothetical protein JOZ66_12835 [Hyphomicrobiales bacterium]|nr:hypothetical protein [Hyphomicrobiales bacterium]